MEHVTLTVFPLQDWLQGRASMLSYLCMAFLYYKLL